MSIHTFLSNLGITKGRKIIIKSGAKANLTTETLDFAELGMTHEGELYVGAMDGSNILINANSTATLDDHTSKVATTLTLGHVKVGDNIKVTNGVISINNATTSQKGVAQIVDNLTTNDSTKVLSASMGKTLKDAIDTIGTVVNGGSLGGITLADIPDSSMTARGLMTTAQYTKLNGISSGANFTTVENKLTSTSTTSALSSYQGKIVNDKIVAHTGDSSIHVTSTDKTTWNGYGSRIYTLENKTVADGSTSQKGIVQIVDNLTTNDNTKVLSASMGKKLKDSIDSIGTVVNGGSLGGITLADIPDATTTQKGLMTTAQVTKLKGIEVNANCTTIENNLTSTSITSGLSANMGKTLKAQIDSISNTVGGMSAYVLPNATTTTLGGVKLNNTVTSTSTTEAATPSAVKQVYDLASSKATVANYNAKISTSWTGTSAPFTQTIAVSGISSTDNPIIFPIYSSTNTTAIAESEAWSLIGKITTTNNAITVTCFEEKPTSALNIQIKVV